MVNLIKKPILPLGQFFKIDINFFPYWVKAASVKSTRYEISFLINYNKNSRHMIWRNLDLLHANCIS